mmetsp:Transcript_17679/g.62235  ORF Transcript_17679/g.62235 Transcript_17679/m.62235 type:complete len:236 (+) Transcript_17679:95-802(+)
MLDSANDRNDLSLADSRSPGTNERTTPSKASLVSCPAEVTSRWNDVTSSSGVLPMRPALAFTAAMLSQSASVISSMSPASVSWNSKTGASDSPPLSLSSSGSPSTSSSPSPPSAASPPSSPSAALPSPPAEDDSSSSSSSAAPPSLIGHLPRSSSSSHGIISKPPLLYHCPNSSYEMRSSSSVSACSKTVPVSSSALRSMRTTSSFGSTSCMPPLSATRTVRKARRYSHSSRRLM